eukprot:1595483-Amphidinium_carterae.2
MELSLHGLVHSIGAHMLTTIPPCPREARARCTVATVLRVQELPTSLTFCFCPVVRRSVAGVSSRCCSYYVYAVVWFHNEKRMGRRFFSILLVNGGSKAEGICRYCAPHFEKLSVWNRKPIKRVWPLEGSALVEWPELGASMTPDCCSPAHE